MLSEIYKNTSSNIKNTWMFLLFNRDYVTYMLMLVVFYLLFPAFTMMSCYDAIYKQFKKIHHYRVNEPQQGVNSSQWGKT